MITEYKPIKVLPEEIQKHWMAQVTPATPTDKGVFRLVSIRKTRPGTYEEQRVKVLVVDENGHPIPRVDIAFSYSTAEQYTLANDFLWTPPSPQKAFVVPTSGSGEIDQIQNKPVNKGEPGGVTVYALESEYSSDVVNGLGMLADHTGLHLTLQLRRVGVVSTSEQLKTLVNLQARINHLSEAGRREMESINIVNKLLTRIEGRLKFLEDYQKSHDDKYEAMMEVAKEYYTLLEKEPKSTSEEIKLLKEKLDILSEPFSDHPAYVAFLKYEREVAFIQKDWPYKNTRPELKWTDVDEMEPERGKEYLLLIGGYFLVQLYMGDGKWLTRGSSTKSDPINVFDDKIFRYISIDELKRIPNR